MDASDLFSLITNCTNIATSNDRNLKMSKICNVSFSKLREISDVGRKGIVCTRLMSFKGVYLWLFFATTPNPSSGSLVSESYP